MTVAGSDADHVKSVEVLGVPIHCVSMDRALDLVDRFVASGNPHLVVTADATSLVIASGDPGFRDLMCHADLVTPDGRGVAWAISRKGGFSAPKVSGVDLLERICAASADRGYRVFFLGAQPGVAELAAERLCLKYPGCNIVGTRNGYFPSESDAVVAAEIAAAKPDILFVGMGMPRQEQFIRSTEEIVGAKVSIGVGGSFDVFSGRVKRAPKWMQRAGLEWLWRLMQDRTKLSKVSLLPKFVMLVLRDRK